MRTFEWAYTNYRDVVLRFAIQCVGRRELAEEIAAEAFLELHQHWASIQTDRLPSWLFTVVKNRAADYWRRRELEKRYVVAETQVSERPKYAEGTGLFDNAALKPVHRICLTLRYVHDMSLREIAQRLGLNEMQIKGHLQYARAILRKQFSA
ncbi:MAG TPA: sigma-70 family RNA polymerase sigma factor [Bryobacteraceae bacterium]|jgi:RNA polymerase sigma-70 factor (ECF subfamily)|nr:sigma-70 family RNA polymerase sigma factor [Bryobacteraceae bacterium]